MNKDEKKMIEEMADTMDKLCCERFALSEGRCYAEMTTCGQCQAKDLYNANYRKVADDEIVVTKRQYEQLKKHNTDRKRLRNKWQTAEREAEYWKNRCVEIGDVASRETAREIFQKMKDGIENSEFGYLLINRNNIIELAKNLGIELE